MHTECAEVGSNLRKYYRFYIGQGIPDPWITYPPAYNSKYFLPSDSKETRKHRKHSDCSRGPCVCCQKEYLFECPDKCASKYCSFTDGNSKNTIPVPQSDVKCRCNDIYQNRGVVSSPNESESETEEEIENLNDLKNPPLCECFISRKTFSSSSEKSVFSNGEYCEKPYKSSKNYRRVKGNRKICFCPLVRQLCLRKPSGDEGEKSFPEPKIVVSKEIQTDMQHAKNSKTVQTEKQIVKAQPKCTCANKYYSCSLNAYRQWQKRGCQAIYSIPNVCCASSFVHNPAVACPYAFMNHFTIHRCERHDNSEVKKHKNKKKQPKVRENEEDSNAELEVNQSLPNQEESNFMAKGKTKWEFADRDFFEMPKEASVNSKNFYYTNHQSKPYEHLKYITDDKFKSYLQGQSPIFSFPPSAYSGSKMFSFPEGESFFQNSGYDRFKTFSFNRLTPFDSTLLENKMNRGDNLYASKIRQSYFSDESRLGFGDMRVSKNDIIMKPSDEMNDYTEGRSSGLVRSQTKYTKVLRKRRKCLASEKRRKLTGSGEAPLSEYNPSLKKISNYSEKQGTKVEGNPQQYVKNLEKIFHAENFNSSSGLFNFDKTA